MAEKQTALGYKGFSQLKINIAQNISTFTSLDEVTKEDVTTLVAADIICGSIATTPKKRIGFGE